MPLAAYLMIFQILVLRQPVEEAFILFCGLAGAVIVGLAVFMEGLKYRTDAVWNNYWR